MIGAGFLHGKGCFYDARIRDDRLRFIELGLAQKRRRKAGYQLQRRKGIAEKKPPVFGVGHPVVVADHPAVFGQFRQVGVDNAQHDTLARIGLRQSHSFGGNFRIHQVDTGIFAGFVILHFLHLVSRHTAELVDLLQLLQLVGRNAQSHHIAQHEAHLNAQLLEFLRGTLSTLLQRCEG